MRSRIPSFTQCVGPGDVHRTVFTQLTQENTHSDHEMLELATADQRCSGVPLFRRFVVPAFRCSGVPLFQRFVVPLFRRSVVPAFQRSSLLPFYFSNSGRLGTSWGTSLAGGESTTFVWV